MKYRNYALTILGLSCSLLAHSEVLSLKKVQKAQKDEMAWNLIQRVESSFEKSDAASNKEGNLVLKGNGCEATLAFSDTDLTVTLTQGSSTSRFSIKGDIRDSSAQGNTLDALAMTKDAISATNTTKQKLNVRLSQDRIQSIEVPGRTCTFEQPKSARIEIPEGTNESEINEGAPPVPHGQDN